MHVGQILCEGLVARPIPRTLRPCAACKKEYTPRPRPKFLTIRDVGDDSLARGGDQESSTAVHEPHEFLDILTLLRTVENEEHSVERSWLLERDPLASRPFAHELGDSATVGIR